eukprot:187324_1
MKSQLCKYSVKCRMIRQSARIELYIQDAGERTVFAHQNNILLTNRKRTISSYKISIDDRIIPFTHAKRHLILHDIITVLYGEASPIYPVTFISLVAPYAHVCCPSVVHHHLYIHRVDLFKMYAWSIDFIYRLSHVFA